MTIRSSNRYGSVVTHNLSTNHSDSFALGWVNLPWHDR
jgi:hypothetical protein